MPPAKRHTGPNALRRGRFSTARANYFVTLCLEPRVPLLCGMTAQTVLSQAHALSADRSWDLRCMTVMPDHLNLLFTLGERLSLSQAIGRLKAKTRPLFSPRGAGWQQNFYDHQLRPDDSIEATIRYIYLNPYAAERICPTDPWPFFYCRPDDWSWFEPLTNSAQPFPDWLR